MGCASSTVENADLAVAVASKEIDRALYAERKALETQKVVKLLLLGTGEAGKSTILKQMKIIYGSGFTEDDLRIYRSAIIMNAVHCTKALISGMDQLEIPYGFIPPTPDEIKSFLSTPSEDLFRAEQQGAPMQQEDVDLSFISPLTIPRLNFNATPCPPRMETVSAIAASKYHQLGGPNQDHPTACLARAFRQTEAEHCDMFGIGNDESVPSEKREAMQTLWRDSGVQYCASRGKEFQLMESCPYLMNHLARICHPSYAPTETDILSMRVMTTSISETRFLVKNVTYRVFDVGGQRSQRKKWAPLFDDVDAIIFVAAIGQYDQVCYEARDTNRVEEAMTVFKSIVNHKLFQQTGTILFLNKIDIFKEKVTRIPIANYFSSYEGQNHYEDGIEFFEEQFRALNKTKGKVIYIHRTWATDTKQIRKILNAVYECILEFNLSNVGI